MKTRVVESAGVIFSLMLFGAALIVLHRELAAHRLPEIVTEFKAIPTTRILLALFFSPLIAMVGSYPPITAPALVIVGAMMIQNVAKGSLGESLCQLEAGLMQLQEMDAETLTGSEARTLLAILTHVREQAEQIEASIRQLWRTTD